MKLKIYKNPICLLWMLKIIFDMLYQIKLLSIVIMLYASILLFGTLIKKRMIKLTLCDKLVLCIFFLFTISWLKSPNMYLDYVKLSSSFFLYFLGRLYHNNIEAIYDTICGTYLFALVVNLVVCIVGNGTIIWGNAITLKGVYYFKTDFAIMLCYFLIVWIFNSKMTKKKIIFALITLVLIFMCNARIMYLCSLVIMIIYYQYKTNNLKKFITLQNICKIALVLVGCIYLLRYLSNSAFFINRGFISLQFDTISDLFNSSNTQGRNKIWTRLLYAFSNKGILTKIFGASLDFNSIYGLANLNEHSVYIKVLLNTGYFGLSVFIAFLLASFYVINQNENRHLSYFTLSLLAVFIITGFSVPTILYTNYSWLPFFMIGVCVSRRRTYGYGE